MSRIIRNRTIVEDPWTLAAQLTQPPHGTGRLIVPLERWRVERETLRDTEVGVLLANAEDVEAIFPEIAERPLIALQFPTFTDGRALTQAILLRNRLGFRAELRAVGDVVRDLVFWLGRCGFDVIVPRPDQDLEACRAALDEIRQAYQPAADGHAPAWARRRSSGATHSGTP